MISNYFDRRNLKDINARYIAGQCFEFAYAITCHISQGSQFDRVIYIEETLGKDLQPALNLVGATRSVKQLIYVNNNNRRFPRWDTDPDMEAVHNAHLKRMQAIIDRKEAREKVIANSPYSKPRRDIEKEIAESRRNYNKFPDERIMPGFGKV